MRSVYMRIKAAIVALCLFAVGLFFGGCTTKYEGDYPELCALAWDNIPTAQGYISNGEASYDPEIVVLETDAYGRVLFSYAEGYTSAITQYVLIMQYQDGQYAYCYADDCYAFITSEASLFDEHEVNLECSQVVALKELNDWGQPINESKCKAVEIAREKPEGTLKLKNDFFEDMIREYHENSGRYIHPKNYSFVWTFQFVTSDDYGRELYVVNSIFDEYTDKAEIRYVFDFLVVVNPDKSYDRQLGLVLLEDARSPQNEVKTVKRQNGWNMPR